MKNIYKNKKIKNFYNNYFFIKLKFCKNSIIKLLLFIC